MHVKSIFLVAGLLGIFGSAGYFAHRNASPVVVAERQSEGTLESPASGAFSGLARSRDGRLLAIVKDNKKIGVPALTGDLSSRL